MLTKLEMELYCREELSYQMASLFHGALIELLPGNYADYLHLSQLHPYTQHLELKDKKWYWVVCCLNKKAAQIIIHDTLEKINCIKISKRDMEILITNKNYFQLSHEELLRHFYEKDSSRFIQMHFVTPTAFKKQGRYLFFPDIRCMYQSLMNKYDSAVKMEAMKNEETLKLLCENSSIIRYDLKSVKFHLEGIKIPSFIGKLTIKMFGTQTITNFANMLFEFGTYSGVGIKTALGMGNIKLLDEKGIMNDR